jgi:hypothetical protein
MSDTTRSLTAGPDDSAADASNIHGAPSDVASPESTLDGSFVSGIDGVPKTESPSGSGRSTGSVAMQALKADNAKPAGLPQGSKKAAPDSSRDAAADALKKFFEKR